MKEERFHGLDIAELDEPIGGDVSEEVLNDEKEDSQK